MRNQLNIVSTRSLLNMADFLYKFPQIWSQQVWCTFRICINFMVTTVYIRRIRVLVKEKLNFPNIFSMIPTFSIFLIPHVQNFPALHKMFPRLISGNTTDEILTFHKLYIQLFQLRLSTSKAEKSNTSAKGCWESLTN